MATQESLERRGFTQRHIYRHRAITRRDRLYDKCQREGCPEFFEVVNKRQKFCGNSCRQLAFQAARKPIVQIEVPREERLAKIEERLTRIEERLGMVRQ
jgi:hypothetical protein